jgi:2,3-bisphosphoglycerate-independent phosphoglycerate mutase
MTTEAAKQYVLIILDGAGDSNRIDGRSPLALARTPQIDFLARNGVLGRMSTLYPDLPRDSLVAHLGIFGWSPHTYYPHGRASSELLAAHEIKLDATDLVFRANIVRIDQDVLASYNADYIHSEQCLVLVERINAALHAEFPQIELYHNSDFRNTLLIRNANVAASTIACTEPHESQGMRFDFGALVRATTAESAGVVAQINRYLRRVADLLGSEPPYRLFPWGVSQVFQLPSFHGRNNFSGRAAVVGNMDFLHGMAKAGGMEFHKLGTGRPDTDYCGKGQSVRAYLEAGYDFIACHINSPDEASHMYDVGLKITCIEQIDAHIAQPVVDYFTRHPERLGGVMVLPDHYTNTQRPNGQSRRVDSHSLDPVPFALWNGRDCDLAQRFDEDEAALGAYGAVPISHLDALRLLGMCGDVPAATAGVCLS